MSLGAYEEDASALYLTIKSMTSLFGLTAPYLHFDASADALGTLSVVNLQTDASAAAPFRYVPTGQFATLTGELRMNSASRFVSGFAVPHDGSPISLVTMQLHVERAISLPRVGQLSVAITALPPAGVFYDGAVPIRREALPHQLSGATVQMRFNSTDGLDAAPDETDGIMRQSVATGDVEYALTDGTGMVYRRELRVRVLQPDLSCIQAGHAVAYEGTTVFCEPCPAGQSTSLGSAVCDICDRHFFRMSVLSPVTECSRCPDRMVARCDGLDTTLATIALAPGWWRVSNHTQELHWSVDGDEQPAL
jgi:hypothetical protein